MDQNTNFEHHTFDNRHLLIAQIADQYVLKGAFDTPVRDQTVEYVDEFCSRILAVYRTPLRKLHRVERMLSMPIGHRIPRLPLGKLFSRGFLNVVVADIDKEMWRLGDDTDHEVASCAETFAWRITIMTALYHHCGCAWPVDAYEHARQAVASSCPLNHPMTRLKSLLPFLSPPPRKLIDQTIIAEYRQAKRALRSRLLQSGVPSVIVSSAIDMHGYMITPGLL
jgi:hypothetical protein